MQYFWTSQLKNNADFETKHKETECTSEALIYAFIYGYELRHGFWIHTREWSLLGAENTLLWYICHGCTQAYHWPYSRWRCWEASPEFPLTFHHVLHTVSSPEPQPAYLCLHEKWFRLYWLLQRLDRWETERGSHASLSRYSQLSQPTPFPSTEIEPWWAKYYPVLTGRAFWKTGSWVRYAAGQLADNEPVHHNTQT
jgi:hypothetical protein